VAKLTAADAAADDSFGGAASVHSDTAVVGAQWDDHSGSDCGSAYVFSRNQGGPDAWGQVAKLTAADAAADDYFGHAVSIRGDTVLVGAYGDVTAGGWSGSAYVFSRNQGGPDAWGQVAKLTPPAGVISFGDAVALDGDTAVVGSMLGDADQGQAFVFYRDHGGPNTWGLVAQLEASDISVYDSFGRGVALDGDIAVVGAYGDDDGGPESGSVYLFGRHHGGPDAWGELAKVTVVDAAAGDWCGFSIALSDDTALAGAPHDDDGGTDSGSAYVLYGPPVPVELQTLSVK
jgi:hypothetical protein